MTTIHFEPLPTPAPIDLLCEQLHIDLASGLLISSGKKVPVDLAGAGYALRVQKGQLEFGHIANADALEFHSVIFSAHNTKNRFDFLRTGGGLGIADVRDGFAHAGGGDGVDVHHFDLAQAPMVLRYYRYAPGAPSLNGLEEDHLEVLVVRDPVCGKPAGGIVDISPAYDRRSILV